MARTITWAMPAIVFFSSFVAFAACSSTPPGGTQQCVPASSSSSSGGSSSGGTSSSGSSGTASGGVIEEAPGGTDTAGKDSFDHINDPGESGTKDPFEILKERNEEGPPAIRTRLHSCTKLPYSTLGTFLTSRGVNMNSNVAGSAGKLYKDGGDAMGVAKGGGV